MFSEGRNYYSTFKPIIETFLDRKLPVFYITTDLDDPFLELYAEGFDAQYLGEEATAFARIHRIRCKIMLATTPNIGAPGYPLRRPSGVVSLAHVCHAVAGLGNYNKYSLDAYDVVLMPGDFMQREVRIIEKLRNLRPKECISVGLPYLDYLAEKVVKKPSISEPPVVLVAPSWGAKNMLKFCGTDFLHHIAKAGYQLILRPHPQSFKVEKEEIANIELKFKQYKNFKLDRDPDPSRALQQADILISGRSAIRFDFSFLYEKPVISIKLDFSDCEQYEFSDLGKTWEDEAELRIGSVLTPGRDMQEIVSVIKQALDLKIENLTALRTEAIINFQTSSNHIFDWCNAQIAKISRGDVSQRNLRNETAKIAESKV